MQGLGSLSAGLRHSEALAVSGDGSLVAGFSYSGPNSEREAFVWDQANGLRSLQMVLASLGLDVEGWSFLDATGISADGKLIVGDAIHDGQTVAFLADLTAVPVPAAIWLLGSALAGLGIIGGRREKALSA
jgi:uncharacterized membrane protein